MFQKRDDTMALAVKRTQLLPGNSAPSWIVETNITQETSNGESARWTGSPA
ncbi:MAG: hypothetical protein QNJ63_07745 [Calothrix sp. MO_192.B10]|nr:hypothetical protein [Calothrix sp. MO_192.B10]